MSQSKFSFRTFTTFVLVWTFAVLIISGAMLFISPPGRVAHWTNWQLVGQTKEGWQAIHVLMAILFLIGGLFHILRFNWKVLVHYLKRKRTGRNYRIEMIASLVIFLLVLFGTLMEVPPFSSVMILSHAVKDVWEPEAGAAPMPHTELLSLEEVAKRLELSKENAAEKLRSNGITVADLEATLQQIAKSNNTSPRVIYGHLTSGSEASANTGTTLTGIGRMTVADLAEAMGLETEVLISKLEQMGVAAEPTDRARDIATALEVSPHDLPDRIREKP